MKKLWLGVVFMCACGALFALEVKPTVKIGVVFPLTGNNAYMGEMGRAGLEMRLRELNKDNKFRYQIIYEDDGFVFSKTAMAVKKLKDIDKVDVVMTMWGYGSDIALPQLKDSKILHVNVDRWTQGSGERDWACGPSLETNIQKMVDVLNAMGVSRVVYIGTADQGAEMYRKALIAELPQHGMEVVANNVLSQDVRDLRTLILRTQELKPEVIINCCAMPVGQILLRQMREMDVKIPVGHVTAAAYEIDSDLSNGTWMVLSSVPHAEWSAKFKAQFKKDGNYPAPQFYNTLSMVINAYEKLDATKKPTSDEVSESIRSLESFEGSTGTLVFAAPNRYEAPVSYFVFEKGTAQPMTLHELMMYYGKAK